MLESPNAQRDRPQVDIRKNDGIRMAAECVSHFLNRVPMHARKFSYFVATFASCIGLWSFVDRDSGTTDASPAGTTLERSSNADDAVRGLNHREHFPALGELTLSLSAEELQQGFKIIAGPDGDSSLIAHPNSPCWIELPEAQATIFTEPSQSAAGFLGAEACMACHKENYASFLKTSHYSASQAASSDSILGSFATGENKLETNHPDLSFTMTKASDGAFYQNVHLRSLSRSVRFDIVTGSGNLAQTYLFWEGDRLFQMHVSYYTRLKRWINSPGYSDGTAWYARRTIPKCAECHMTYMEPIPASSNRFQRNQVIFGVTCERCHGPGKEHVEHHRKYPGDRTSRFIANPSKLSRHAMNDVCAQCHLGSAEPLQQPFSFRPGDKVEDFWKVVEDEDSPQGNVHSSNQLQRLKMSKCFTGSQMTCADCHDPHRNERGNLALFSQRCIRCHPPADCKKATELGAVADTNCIDCHMGMGYDDHIQMETTDSIHMPLLRDHNVRVLPEATHRLMEQLRR